MFMNTRLLGLLVLLTIVSACTGGSEDGPSETVDESATTIAAPATTTAPTTAGVGTLDDPRPILGGTFTYTEDFSDTEWAGELYGLVEVPLEGFSDAAGTCYAVVGVITPTRIGEGSISEGFTAPGLGLVVDGVLVDEGFDCDTGLIRDAGYGPVFEAQVTQGTGFAFYDAFLVEGDPAPSPTALFVGEAGNDGSVYFTTDLLTSVPAPEVQAGAGAGGDLEPLAGAEFSYRGQFDDTAWNVGLFGVVDGEKGTFTDETGSCLILVGQLIPTELDVGQLSAGFDTPSFSLLAGGAAIDDTGDCDTDAVVAAGYGPLWEAEVTLGTVYPFYADFFVADGAGAESIIAGDPTEDGGARFYSVDVLPTVPPADTSASSGTLPEGITSLAGAEFTYTDPFSETSWEALIDGLVAIEVDRFYDDEVGRCFAVIGIITPTAIGEGLVTDGFDTPDIGLIASGRSVQWNSFFCDDEALKASGYQELNEAEIPVGTAYPYFVSFFVPGDDSISLDSIFIGDASGADAIYYDAALLDTIPLRN